METVIEFITYLIDKKLGFSVEFLRDSDISIETDYEDYTFSILFRGSKTTISYIGNRGPVEMEGITSLSDFSHLIDLIDQGEYVYPMEVYTNGSMGIADAIDILDRYPNLSLVIYRGTMTFYEQKKFLSEHEMVNS